MNVPGAVLQSDDPRTPGSAGAEAQQATRPGQPLLTPAWALFLVVALAVVIGLGSLGVWQVQRLGWKRGLMAATAERVHQDPVPAPAAGQWADVVDRPDEAIYRRVALSGRWRPGQDTWVQATTDLGSGYWLMTPLARDDGSIVLVNRGFVARRQPAPSASVVGPDGLPPVVTVTGLLRTSEGQGVYPRRNDPAADRWFSRDVGGIAARRELGAIAPYFVDAQATTVAGQPSSAAGAEGEPVPGLTIVQFRNHHLGYALTWFVLAAMTAGATWRVWRWHGQAARAPGTAEIAGTAGAADRDG